MARDAAHVQAPARVEDDATRKLEESVKRRRRDQSDWPTFDAPLLQEVATAVLRRRKALRYRAGLVCARAFDETGKGTWERLNLDLQPGIGQLRLSVWEDGVLWLGLSVPAFGRNQGWAFQECFHGDVQDVSPEALVSMLEATLGVPLPPGDSDPTACRERLRAIWARVRPRPG